MCKGGSCEVALLSMIRGQKVVNLVKRVIVVWREEFHFHCSETCFQKAISCCGLKSRLLVAEMQHVIEDYWCSVSKMPYSIERFR